MRRAGKRMLVLIAIVSFAVALSYPVRYFLALRSNNAELEALSALRSEVRAAQTQEPETAAPRETQEPETAAPRETPAPEEAPWTPRPSEAPSPETGESDRRARSEAEPYPMKEKVFLDEARILPELQAAYAINSDLVGWLTIPNTVIDYPVVQNEENDFYLDHDFYGKENLNGQIILDAPCDPYTPSYNLVISGHRMRNGSMFSQLILFQTEGYWQKHKLVEFSTLMERKTYVVFAAFFSADYDVDEEGFRYNADIQYRVEANHWLREIDANRLYETGVDVQFGDEFLTLTTCDRHSRKDGRFVVVCRRLRDGEVFE